MYPGGSNFENEVTANIPNQSLMYTMYTTTFGNMSFVVQPPMPNKGGNGFPSVPYLSLEALLYQGQMSNPMVSPTNIHTGQTAGTQNIQGSQTITDNTGTVRGVFGYDQTASTNPVTGV